MLQVDDVLNGHAPSGAAKVHGDCLQDLLRALSRPSPAAEELTRNFDHFQGTFGIPFKAWAANVFGGYSDVQTLFYPFGGADFCFPYYLFPGARDYILVGREPCSLWPLNEPSASFTPDETVEALRHYLKFSYFITKDLQGSLGGGAIRGVLPLILAQMAQCGLPIISVQPIGVSGEGLRIDFGDRRAPQRLHYFRQDLRDAHWPQSSGLHRRLAASSDLAVFVKSASYLLHEPPFERLRHVIRDQALLLVQDPSGIPYDLLQKWRWNTGLHGRFVSDIPVFSSYDQSSLAQAYRASSDEALLEFGIGYLTNASGSSLVVASPRKPKVPPLTEAACAS